MDLAILYSKSIGRRSARMFFDTRALEDLRIMSCTRILRYITKILEIRTHIHGSELLPARPYKRISCVYCLVKIDKVVTSIKFVAQTFIDFDSFEDQIIC